MGKTIDIYRSDEKNNNLEQDIIYQLDRLIARAREENIALQQIMAQLNEPNKIFIRKKEKLNSMNATTTFQEIKQTRDFRLFPNRKKLTTRTSSEEQLNSSENQVSIEELIKKESSQELLDLVQKHTDNNINGSTYVASTTTVFNIDKLPNGKYEHIINLKRVNDIRRINKFFESVNQKLPENGIFIDNLETYSRRKAKILRKTFFPLNWLLYTLDVIVTRVFPKLPIFKQLYFSITKGRNRVLSRAEIYGRLYSCGFKIIETKEIGDLQYFVCKKVKEPLYPDNPTYGPIIKLKRHGADGKLFSVYKLRTMHAYSEYLQEYIYEMNDLQEGGKFKNDFRITTEGKIFRKWWLDELPMFVNLMKGNMKLVGVRPLSSQYFNLYSEELKNKRIKHKPGLIPPFYADMPKTLEEIMASEMRYLEEYEKRPLTTDIKYFVKAWQNILIKKARSN